MSLRVIVFDYRSYSLHLKDGKGQVKKASGRRRKKVDANGKIGEADGTGKEATHSGKALKEFEFTIQTTIPVSVTHSRPASSTHRPNSKAHTRAQGLSAIEEGTEDEVCGCT